MNLKVAVIHYPVYNKKGEIVATSITGTEIHDVSRTCMTFGVKLCYIVTPLKKQIAIMEMMKKHWTEGYGSLYNPDRKEALSILRTAVCLDEVLEDTRKEDLRPILIGTSAKKRENSITYRELHEMIVEKNEDVLLLFGTGWGLADEIVKRCDRMLEPIGGTGNYNHLSMRVAMGIILDRIFNPRGGKDERDS